MPSDYKKIAKNTVYLYTRMIVILAVNLYTSRIILRTLGFSDYGTYNVVGGIVTMLHFLNVGMSGASQRFISFEMGKGNLSNLKNTICTSVLTHYSIAAIVVLVMESVGFLFLNYKLNIPADRLHAANWVFQCSVVTFVFSIISVPYHACIIAHECMATFAFISVFEAVSKLVVAFAITYASVDKLILYAVLLTIIQVIIRIIYVVYCKCQFEEWTFKYHFDKELFRKMFAFAGWGCVGNIGFSAKDQLSSILLNLFFGTTVNAARGIAGQVNGFVSSFAGNFTLAMNPQITKLYAAGEVEKSRNLVYAGSKYAFLLLSLVVIPFLTNEHYFLTLWLGKIPPYTDAFVFIILIGSMIYAMGHSTATAILATGRVKWLQIGLALILLTELPIAYVVLLFGKSPCYALMPSILTVFISVLYRFVLITKYVPCYSMVFYLKNTIIRCFAVAGFAMLGSFYLKSHFSEGFVCCILTSFCSFLLVLVLSFFMGLTKNERCIVLNKVVSKIRKS